MAIDHRHRFLRHCLQSILTLFVGIAQAPPNAGRVLAFVFPFASRQSSFLPMTVSPSDLDISARSSSDPLRQYVASITRDAGGNDDVQLLPSEEFRSPSPYANATEINSLIFRPKHKGDAEGVYAVAIVQSSDKVDVTKFSKILSKVEGSIYEKWELAPSYLVEDLCGFRPGSIPPIGYATKPFRVIVDDSLTQFKADALLVGGGGSLDYRS